MKKIITRALLNTFSVGLVVTIVFNLGMQFYLNIKSFREAAAENFWQIERILEVNQDMDIFSMIPTDNDSNFYAISMSEQVVIGSTYQEMVGKSTENYIGDFDDLTSKVRLYLENMNGKTELFAFKQTGDILLVKSMSTSVLIKNLVYNTLLLCLYFAGLFLIITTMIYSFMEKNIIRSILNINDSLDKIEHGDYDTVLNENSTAEFSELSKYINSMVASITSFFAKTSKALEVSQIPIGICEYVPETHSFLATSRVQEIMSLSDEEFKEIKEHPFLLNVFRTNKCDAIKELGENVYRLNGKTKRYLRIQSFKYDKSQMTIFIDITDEILNMKCISMERDTDPLTNLYNRGAFYRNMDILYRDPYRLKKCVMFLIDLDKLKRVNDNYGHADGDRYLRAFAEVLHSFDGNVIAARMGGDEFTLFAYGLNSMDEIQEVITKLGEACDVKSVTLQNGESILLSYSFGYAFYPEEESDYNALLKLADERMYKNKKERRPILPKI